jgi:RimJ/RimL family protein N-acetyltransferase
MKITLRPILESDLPIFFAHQQHQPARHMAAFMPCEDADDRGDFDFHWANLMRSDTILKRSIEADGQLVGHIMSFGIPNDQDGVEREITYWIDHHHWGRGIAGEALSQFLTIETTRPLFGRAAKDNVASIRLMERCGFRLIAHERGFANARGEEIDEVVMALGLGADMDQPKEIRAADEIS